MKRLFNFGAVSVIIFSMLIIMGATTEPPTTTAPPATTPLQTTTAPPETTTEQTTVQPPHWYVESYEESDEESPVDGADGSPLNPDFLGNADLIDSQRITFENNLITFITVTTKAGNVFYVLIDHRIPEGEANVYFLTKVNEFDLLSILYNPANEDESAPIHPAQTAQYATQNYSYPGTQYEQLDPNVPDYGYIPASNPEPKKSPIIPTYFIIILVFVAVVLIALGIYMFVSSRKKKSQSRDYNDYDDDDDGEPWEDDGDYNDEIDE